MPDKERPERHRSLQHLLVGTGSSSPQLTWRLTSNPTPCDRLGAANTSSTPSLGDPLQTHNIGPHLEASLVDIPCPGCGYVIEVQLMDVRTNSFHWCPCCRARIHLVDDGSVNAGIADIEEALRKMTSTMRKLTR